MSEPILYRRPIALSREAHGTKRFRPLADFRFARTTNSVPIAASEAMMAARHFPLVFANTDPAGLIAVLGIETGRNLFVDENGQWAKDVYVPAYVRRYPFAFAAQGDQLLLCIDDAADALADTGEDLFTLDGTPAPYLEQVLAFGREFQIQSQIASNFAAAAAKVGMLTENRAEIEKKTGGKIALGGFCILERAAYDALSDADFLAWRKKGWVDLAAAHFMSLGAWTGLLARA